MVVGGGGVNIKDPLTLHIMGCEKGGVTCDFGTIYVVILSQTLNPFIDGGIGLSITIDKIRVFINKTLSTESLINPLLIRGLSYQLLLIVGKLGQGMRSCKCTNHDLYAGGCQ